MGYFAIASLLHQDCPADKDGCFSNDGSRARSMVGETTVHGSAAFGAKHGLKQHVSGCFSL